VRTKKYPKVLFLTEEHRLVQRDAYYVVLEGLQKDAMGMPSWLNIDTALIDAEGDWDAGLLTVPAAFLLAICNERTK